MWNKEIERYTLIGSINPNWSAELKRQYKLIVRNYSRGTALPISDVILLIRPEIVKIHRKKRRKLK